MPSKTVPNRRSTKLWRKTQSLALNSRSAVLWYATLPNQVVLLGFLEVFAASDIGRAAAVAEGEELGSNLFRLTHVD